MGNMGGRKAPKPEALFADVASANVDVGFCKKLAARYRVKWSRRMDDWVSDHETERGSGLVPVGKAVIQAGRLLRDLTEQLMKQAEQEFNDHETLVLVGEGILMSALASDGVDELSELPSEWTDAIVPKMAPEGKVGWLVGWVVCAALRRPVCTPHPPWLVSLCLVVSFRVRPCRLAGCKRDCGGGVVPLPNTH